MTFTDVAPIVAGQDEAELVWEMDEEAFRAFYDRTARPLWLYLVRLTGARDLADDLLQETYYRFLRANHSFEDESHRRNFLFRVATNLARDRRRRNLVSRLVAIPAGESGMAFSTGAQSAEQAALRSDLSAALTRLRPRDRSLLWLAYAHGSSHQEIAARLGLRKASIKLLLFRARRRLASLLHRDPADREGRRRARGPSTPEGDCGGS